MKRISSTKTDVKVTIIISRKEIESQKMTILMQK